jgi:thiol:disulfide interchange protein
MKKIALIFLIITLSIYAQGNETLSNFNKLKWQTNWEETFIKADKQNKRVIVFVNEDYCKWCKKMKKTTLSDKMVQQKLNNYVLFKVKRSNKEIMKHIEDFSGAIPSFYIFSPKGKQLDNIVGYFQKEDFMDYLNEIEKENN